MAAKIDLQKTSRITLNSQGYRAQRIALVSGVTGDNDALLYNAINDAALPDIGDAHPEIASITLNDLVCEPLGGGQYKITLIYYKDAGIVTGTSNAESRASASLAVENEQVDLNGDALKTQYSFGGTLYNERFTAQVERPRVTFDFEYTANTFPQTEIDTYLGKINSAIWNGYAVETVLCSNIDVRQAGDDYRVTFSFAYNPATWVFNARATSTGLTAHPTDPDSELDLTTGVRPFDIYDTVSFASLGFTL